MQYKFINIFLAFLISFFGYVIWLSSSVVASAPAMEGTILFLNADGTKSDKGIAGIWVEWSDRGNNRWYTKTDSNGRFNFPYLGDSGWEEKKRLLRRTWIKPTEPEIQPIIAQDENADYSSQGYVRTYWPDIYDPAFGCGENPHKITAVQPKNWSGIFVESVAQETGLENLPKSLSGASIGDINFSNSNRKVNIGTYYYQATIISGTVLDNASQRPIANAGIVVTDGQKETPGTTDSSGRFTIREAATKGGFYAVRLVNIPNGYIKKAKTTNNRQSMRYDALKKEQGNTPLNSESYEVQLYGTKDCATSSQNGTAGSCNFVLDQDPGDPPPQNNPSTPPGGNGSPSPAPPGGGNPPGTFPPPLPLLDPPVCTQRPDLSSPLQFVAINNQTTDLHGVNRTIKVIVSPDPDKPFSINVPVFYQDRLCQTNPVKIIKLKYEPKSGGSGGPSDPNNPNNPNDPNNPNKPSTPQPCSSATNKKDGCSCEQNSQCFGKVCNTKSGTGVCKTPPSIQVEGGDVHSNRGINIGEE